MSAGRGVCRRSVCVCEGSPFRAPIGCVTCVCVSRTLSGRRAAPPARLQKLGVQKYSTKMWLPIATAYCTVRRCKTFCREMEELAAASRAAVAAAKAAAAARAAGPLPDGWQKFMTAEGEPYYYHEASKKTQWAFPAPRPKVAIDILTGPDVRDRYKYEACFYVRYDMHRFVEHKCTDDVLLSELKQLEPWGPNGIAFGITCDKLRADPFRRSWISDMLDR